MFLSILLLYYISTHSFKSHFDNRATYLLDIFEQKISKSKGVDQYICLASPCVNCKQTRETHHDGSPSDDPSCEGDPSNVLM